MQDISRFLPDDLIGMITEVGMLRDTIAPWSSNYNIHSSFFCANAFSISSMSMVSKEFSYRAFLFIRFAGHIPATHAAAATSSICSLCTRSTVPEPAPPGSLSRAIMAISSSCCCCSSWRSFCRAFLLQPVADKFIDQVDQAFFIDLELVGAFPDIKLLQAEVLGFIDLGDRLRNLVHQLRLPDRIVAHIFKPDFQAEADHIAFMFLSHNR